MASACAGETPISRIVALQSTPGALMVTRRTSAPELLGLALSIYYVDKEPGDRRWLGFGVLIFAVIVLVATVDLLAYLAITASTTSLSPPD